MAEEIEEIWLIKDKENQTCGFVLDQDEAFFIIKPEITGIGKLIK